MAIIIPSKNIYEIDNQKVRNNVIDNVSVEQKVVTPNNEYDVSVFNKDYPIITSIESDYFDTLKRDTQDAIYNQKTFLIWGYIKIIPYYTVIEIKVPKLQKNKYIQFLYLGKDKEDNYKIGTSLHYNKYDGSSTMQVKIDNYENKFQNLNYSLNVNPTETNNIKEFSPSLSHKYRYNGVSPVDYKVEISNFENYTNLNGDIDYKNDKENTTFKIKILSRYDIITLDGMQEVDLYSVDNTDWFTINGNIESYIADNISITVNGDTIGIDLTDGSITYGSGNKPYSLSGNELLQDSGKVESANLAEHLGNNVLNQYGKGKETAVLLCDINNYRNESGNLAISINKPKRIKVNVDAKTEVTYKRENDGLWYATFTTTIDSPLDEYLNVIISTIDQNGYTEELTNDIPIGSISSTIKVINVYEYINITTKAYYTKQEVAPNKKTFSIGDEVIPMVFSAIGSDIPMSKYQNGNAKTFTVVGRDIIYDGAVWQKLYLQEKCQ